MTRSGSSCSLQNCSTWNNWPQKTLPQSYPPFKNVPRGTFFAKASEFVSRPECSTWNKFVSCHTKVIHTTLTAKPRHLRRFLLVHNFSTAQPASAQAIEVAMRLVGR